MVPLRDIHALIARANTPATPANAENHRAAPPCAAPRLHRRWGARQVDGDGIADAGDCAPDDPAISPRVAEERDGVDNNCNLLVDEGLPTTTAYPDGDSDGYGSDTDAVEACAPPTGTVTTGGDCHDADPAVHPDAGETCEADGIDQDFDGLVDADDPDALATAAW